MRVTRPTGAQWRGAGWFVRPSPPLAPPHHVRRDQRRHSREVVSSRDLRVKPQRTPTRGVTFASRWMLCYSTTVADQNTHASRPGISLDVVTLVQMSKRVYHTYMTKTKTAQSQTCISHIHDKDKDKDKDKDRPESESSLCL